jgi:putative ABC transport system permease protein
MMSWIALKMLVGDKAKFCGIVLGLTFASLLITQQGSIFCGLMCRTAGQVYDITGADLWVMDANVRHVDDVKPMIENSLYRVRGVEGVRWAVPLYKGNARAKINSLGIDPGTKQETKFEVIEQVILLGLDDSSMVGAPPPGRMVVGTLEDLRKPDAVIVDFTRLDKLYPGEDWSLQNPPGLGKKIKSGVRSFSARVTGGQVSEEPESMTREAFYARFLGRELEMNDHRAIIVGICEATRTFQSNAVVYTTYSRAKRFAPQERKVLSYVLAKTEQGKTPAEVAKAIALQTGLKARTSKEFIDDTIDYYLKYTGIPINFGITAMLGFLVGTAIAGQTFYNFTIENLKQFGALKAMGATNGRIVAMILLQATVVGLLGYGLGVGLAAGFGLKAGGTELAYYTPWQLLPITGGAVVLICILASILSVRRVVVLEPAVVFRG